jgi:tRNA A-37 threonylcarbamoyl transferase component Bud32
MTVQQGTQWAYYLLTEAEGIALTQLGLSPIFYAIWLDGFALLMLAAFIILGLFIFVRRSDNVLSLLIAQTVIILGITYNTSINSLVALDQKWWFPAAIIQAIGQVLSLLVMFVLPDGKFVPRWSRWIILAAVVWFSVRIGAAIPLTVQPDDPLSRIGTLVGLLLVLSGLAAQYYRYRNTSDEGQKTQIRWVVLGLFIGIMGFTAYILPPFLFEGLKNGMGRVIFNLIGVPLFVTLPSLMIPATIAQAIIRHQLLGVQFILNRALVAAGLTGILGLLYFVAVVCLQLVFQGVTGGEQSPIAITVSTLLIAALFQPLRQRLQRIVTNQFSARRTLDKRATSVTDRVGVMLGDGRLNGVLIGQYQVDGLIGQGGMAEVYRAHHMNLKREAAIKVLSPNLALDPDFRRRFEREAQTIAALIHPNIVQVFDFGENAGNFYMAMNFIKGDNLATYLSRVGKLPLETALPILQDIAAALDFAHAQGVVHRDVKPSNVMVQPIDTPTATPTFPYKAILTDFGLARLVTGAGGHTQTGVLGTLSYIAPEQITDSRNVTTSADIYALGIIAYQMVTARIPFEGENPGEILMAHLQKTPADPRTYNPELPIYVSSAILRALSKQPADRYETAGSFIRDLQSIPTASAQT